MSNPQPVDVNTKPDQKRRSRIPARYLLILLIVAIPLPVLLPFIHSAIQRLMENPKYQRQREVANQIGLEGGKVITTVGDIPDRFEHEVCIELRGNVLTAEQARRCSIFPQHTAVHLTDCADVEEALDVFAHNSSLATVQLQRCGLTKAAAQKLAGMPRLTALTIIEPGPDFDFSFLRNLHLQSFSLIGAEASDAALEHAGQIKHLQRLNLQGTKITSRGIKQILKMQPSLVTVSASCVTPSDIKALQNRLPAKEEWYDPEPLVVVE